MMAAAGDGGGGETERETGEAAVFSACEIEYVSYGGEQHLPLIMGLVDAELSEPYSIFTYRYFVYLWPNLSFLAFHGGRCVGTVVCKMGEHRGTLRGYIAMLVVIKPYRGRGIDFAGDRDKRRSSTGYVFTMAGGSVSWVSCLQSAVALSTAEAEYMVATHVCKETIWLKRLCEEFKVNREATELVTRSIRVMMESGCEEVTLEAEVTNKGALALYGRLGFIRAKRLFRYYLNGVDAFRLKLLFPRPDPMPLMSLEKNESHEQSEDHQLERNTGLS